jgi:NUMOD4 motif/HNH endonuclease/AP2 domain
MEEIWKDIDDSKGLYQVSNLGNVKSLKFGKERILKFSTTHEGYNQVTVIIKNTYKRIYIHQLVAISFLNHTPCGYKLVVNHKNFNRQDNRAENLEIVTMRENTNHKHLESSSQYTGVHWDKRRGKWKSKIYKNPKHINLGQFETEKEASEYYENAVLAIKNGTEIVIKKHKFSSSYKGVAWHDLSKKWIAQIQTPKHRKYLGIFTNEIDAHNAYQKAIKNKNLL